MKQTRCKICRTLYTKWSISQKTCSDPNCAIELMRRDKEKRQRKELKAAKERIKSRREWLLEAQKWFNGYIRQRDNHLPCISCGRHHNGQYHAGHYLSVGACPELRFDECNVHKQCSTCNNYRSGNISRYRVRLIKKIGIDKVEWLEGPHEPRKRTIEELKEIIATYKRKLKELKQ